jgi:LmbE family N-acetylglucosaminyl deacetylase
MISPSDRYLILAPHPDDETIGAGGLAAAASARGCAVGVVVLTDGGGLAQRAGSGDQRGPELIASRQAQCRAATAALGIGDVQFLDARDGSLGRDAGRIAPLLAQSIGRIRPTHLLYPHPTDRHRDHRVCHQLALDGLSRAGLRAPVAMLGYEIWSTCQPTHCLDITDFIDSKRRALECYRDTFRRVDLAEMGLGLNRYRAASELLRSGWAEAFQRLG